MALTEKRKQYLKEWRLKNLEKQRERQRKWQKKNRKNNPEKVKEYDKISHKRRREKERVYARSYKKKVDPIKLSARTILNNAVRLGKIIKPNKCQNCENKKIQGHHPDYTKPLEVIWLCTKHHELEHHPY